MKGETSGNDLQSLLEAIKSSDVVEARAQLIAKIGELDITEDYELTPLLESLIILWEDFTCLDVSQCMLNKTILHVAEKFQESGISRCARQFLALGTKASMWCGKHLKMTVMTTEESQEEHSSLFFQLLLNLLSYSASTISALGRCPVSSCKDLMVDVEIFILEQLNLTKDSISVIKRIDAVGSEVLKGAQVVLDSVTRLCRVYINGINWDLDGARIDNPRNYTDRREFDSTGHIINLTKCTVEKLCEVGILAANDGGSLVGVLNLSWKSVVALLQLGKGALASKVNIADIILALIDQANGTLRCAAESWSLPQKEKVSVTEAKRTFLPVKFYLINAARIISHYPSQAFLVYKDITLCVLLILTFRLVLSKEELLKSASEALTELLEPTSCHLLNTLLNSAQVKQEHKFQILDWLFSYETNSNINLGEHGNDHSDTNSMDALFSVSADAASGAKILLLGRIASFLNLLNSSTDLEDNVRLGISRKLGWFLDIVIDEDVYSSILVLKIPILNGSSQTQELYYQPMFSSILHALKTFMIVVASTVAWDETVSFLLANFFHPHFLCWEIVMELLCFIVRHAEIDLVIDIIDKLCSLLRFAASSESIFIPGSGLRKIARSLCMLLTYCSPSMVDRVYNIIIGSNRSKLSSSMYGTLLMEGFPLNLLSEKVKSIAKEKIVTEYFEFLESFLNESIEVCDSGVFVTPVLALSAALQSQQVSVADNGMKTLKLLVAFINKYRNCEGNVMKDHYRKLLSETLGVVSNMKHLYVSDEMERVIIELQTLFISGPAVSDADLFHCKPNLVVFMAGLSHVELAENDDSAKIIAIWELYHMLLRERHWAFVHLAISAFGYFAGHTKCNQLWRFVPEDAALSFDVDSGKEANEERFMCELKGFLEKETARLAMTSRSEQLELLVKEAKLLKENIQKVIKIDPDAMICDPMEVDNEIQATKRRKLPDGVGKGVELLQSGLKVFGDGLSSWQQNHLENSEIHEKFLTHFACLEDVINHLASLAGSG